MKTNTRIFAHRRPRGLFSAGLALLTLLLVFTGCPDEVVVDDDGGSTGGGGDGGGGNGGSGGGLQQGTTNKVDLLFVIDNSRSMADKQELLGQAIPHLITSLTSDPRFPPMQNMHIGVISSSLGSYGADACAASSSQTHTENDQGRLIYRSSSDPGALDVPTWNNQGFLVWDPNGAQPTHSPPGETDPQVLAAGLSAMVNGAGEVGCGFEAPLEAMYRFLIDPDPYLTAEVVNNTAQLSGTDDELLNQRTDFLRPDSALAIVILSDENDCSTRHGQQFFYAGQIYTPGTNQPYHLPKPRAACAVDPNDACCRSCAQPPGDGCDTSQDDCEGPLTALDDHVNLRCFDQKRRFGLDFLWPMERYTDGLTKPSIADRFGNVVPNPLYTDLNPNDEISQVRDPSLVFVNAIVGVPWQDISRQDAAGSPDLLTGLNAENESVGGFRTAAELSAAGAWDTIVGDPSNYVPPADPFMVESIDPRAGSNPFTGDAIMPPNAAPNAINGHEFSNPQRNLLQYSCIFPLLTPRDCQPGPTEAACDCNDPSNDHPICSSNPADNGQPTLQTSARAFPGLRQLALLKSFGERASVGSVCAAQVANPGAYDYGYTAALTGLVDTMVPALQAPTE